MTTAVAAWVWAARALSTRGAQGSLTPPRAGLSSLQPFITQQSGQQRPSSVWRACQRPAAPSTTPLLFSPPRRLVHTGDAYTAAHRDKAVKMAGPLGLIAGLFGSVVGEEVSLGAHTLIHNARFVFSFALASCVRFVFADDATHCNPLPRVCVCVCVCVCIAPRRRGWRRRAHRPRHHLRRARPAEGGGSRGQGKPLVAVPALFLFSWANQPVNLCPAVLLRTQPQKRL
jgi:hypothetical protein